MSLSDDQCATYVGLLHGQDTEDGIVRTCGEKKIIENETEQQKRGVSARF